MADICSCCSLEDGILGITNLVKISDKHLEEILKEESGGKKQRVANNLKAQNDRILRHVFNLGHGFEKSNDRRFTFNNLAMDKLRKDKDSSSDLGKICCKSFQYIQLFYSIFQPNCSTWAMVIRCLTTWQLLTCCSKDHIQK